MNVTICLEEVRAHHSFDGRFILFEMENHVPFRIQHCGMIMKPYLVLKLMCHHPGKKMDRVRFAAQLKFHQREKFLMDELNKNVATEAEDGR